MTPPLDGLHVVELTTMITGPMAGMMLADLGADVIKIEHPDGGDPFRSFRGEDYSPYFCAYNRNKRSVTLDLRSEKGAAALRKLISAGDILLDNFRPGVLERLGLNDAQIRALNPDIIHCSVTGFGASGPYAGRPAYDAVAQALSGMSSMFLDPENPEISGPTIADNVTAHCACQGVLAAVVGKARGQPARRVEVNMLDATVAFMPDSFGLLHQMGIMSDTRLRARSSQSFAFACSDGRLVSLHLSSRDKFWEALVEALQYADLSSDPRFSTREARIDNYDDLRKAIAPYIRRRPRAEWLEIFAKHDLPAAPVYDLGEVGDDPHIRHLETFHTIEHTQEGFQTAIRRPIWFDGARQDQPVAPPPTLGEHTEDVLHELDNNPRLAWPKRK